jgi:uncharacterized membrane protein
MNARRRRSRRDRGSVTLWALGMCLIVLAVGGIGMDLWRAYSERRALGAAADAAALAGASAIDVDFYRSTGAVRLDRAEAARRAAVSLATQLDRRSLTRTRISARSDEVAVVVRGRVTFTLLRLVGGSGFELRIASNARPQPAA